ncbi:ABC transporter substrate-binding protein [Aeromicrobium panaciterrae]
MKTRYLGPLLVATIATALASCSSGGGSKGDDIVKGGSLVFASNVEPDCLDPGTSAYDITAVVGRHLFDTLLWQAPDGSIEPGLATSYKVSDDATAFDFTLRKGVTFSDGTPLDAGAVKATFDRIADPKTGSQYAVGLLGPYKGTTVVDALHVRVEFTKSFAPFLQGVTQGFLGIIAPSSFEKGKNPCTDPIGSGPFVLKKFTPQDSVVLSQRPEYDWAPKGESHDGPAYLDEVTFKVVPEDEVRVGLLRSNEIDALGVIPPLEIGSLKDEGFDVIESENPGAPYVVYINSSRAPFDDVRARRAVQAAVDIDGILKSVYDGRYPRAWGPLAPGTPGYEKSVEGTWGNKPGEAAKLLDDLGYTRSGDSGIRELNGKPLTLELAFFSGDREQRNEVVTLLQAQLKDAGIDLKLLPETEAAEALGANTYDAGEFSFVSGDPDILSTLFSSANVGKDGEPGSNMSAVKDDEIDAQLAVGIGSIDAAKRADAYGKIQKRVVDQAYALPIYVPTYFLASSSEIGGVTFGPQSDVRFYSAYRKG